MSDGGIPEGNRLKIHSAKYGSEEFNYQPVSEEALLKHNAGGISVLISNHLAPFDPAPNAEKHLIVEYSYGEEWRHHFATRPDGQLLVLPEDPWLQLCIQQGQKDLAKVIAESARSVIFGDAIQPSASRPFAWWYIPVIATGEMRDCTVTVEVLGKTFELLWILGDDPPTRRTTLYPKKWALIPLVARSDDKTVSCSHPIAFKITKGKSCITALSGVVNDYHEIPVGKHLLRLQVRSDADPGRPVWQCYHLFNPSHGADNSRFYLRHWDEYGELHQYRAESGGVEPHP